MHLPEYRIKQMQWESDSWKRLLGFISDENIHLKNMLSENLKNGFEPVQLSELENFQTQFIKEDELIALLRNDIAGYDKLLLHEIVEDGKLVGKVNKKMKELRGTVRTADRNFGKLKSSFHSYLTENCS